MTTSDVDAHFMKIAIQLARRAAEYGDTPVGALVVLDGQILGEGYNRIERDRDPTAHAELIALREAGRRRGDWRLHGATLYATLEPCVMCAAAALHARVSRVVFGAYDERWGGVGSLFDLSHDPRMNHEFEVASGVEADMCAKLCRTFFAKVRQGRILGPIEARACDDATENGSRK
ncbi:MAG: tRNA adenosine(34) deaminase TadA [Desulfomonilaceae bacterium]